MSEVTKLPYLIIKRISSKVHSTSNVVVDARFISDKAWVIKPAKELLLSEVQEYHLRDAGLTKKAGCLIFTALGLIERIILPFCNWHTLIPGQCKYRASKSCLRNLDEDLHIVHDCQFPGEMFSGYPNLLLLSNVNCFFFKSTRTSCTTFGVNKAPPHNIFK